MQSLAVQYQDKSLVPCCVQADVNVSLTSISLLWNASDLLGKLYTKARISSSRSSLESEPVANGNTGSPGSQLDSEQYQELVRLLYGALQVGCTCSQMSSAFVSNACRALTVLSCMR